MKKKQEKITKIDKGFNTTITRKEEEWKEDKDQFLERTGKTKDRMEMKDKAEKKSNIVLKSMYRIL